MFSGRRLFFSLIAILCMGGQVLAQTWSDPVTIGNGYTPDIDVDPQTGNIHVVHHNGSVIYTLLSPSGDILIQESIPGTEADGTGKFDFGATVANDPTTGRPHVFYRVNVSDDYFDIYYTKRNADGTWTTGDRMVNNQKRAYSVRTAVDNNGVVHMVYGQADPNNMPFGSATYRRIDANGFVTNTIGGLTKYRVDDRVELTVGKDNSIHVLLSYPFDNPNGELTYYRSDDGGDTLPRVGNIASNQATGRNGNGDVFVDAQGNVHFVYGSAADNSIGGTHSVRYARFENGSKVRDLVVNDQGELADWHHNVGVGSVAASDDGKYIFVVYNKGDGLSLHTRYSTDMGQTWSERDTIASQSGGSESRDKHVVRATGNTFYTVYPSYGKVFFRTTSFGPVNQAPVADAGGPYTAVEGDTVTFDASGSSDDGQIVEYRWDFDGDGTAEDTTTSATTTYSWDDDFSATGTLEVVDDGGKTAQAQFSVTISNANPVADAGGPYTAAPNEQITLSGSVSDAGAADTHTFAWDLDNDGTFETSGQQVVTSYVAEGTKTIRLQVTDDDGGVDIDTTTVTVTQGIPEVSEIPAQTVQEGQAFSPITLDDYVTDPNNSPSEMTWGFFGNSDLQVSIENRVATVAVPDSEWAGAETISFFARDPDGNADTTATTFTVTPVNDPPQVSAIPSQTVEEGKPFSTITLDDFVFDPDHADSEIVWTVSGNNELKVTIEGRKAAIAAPDSEWAGSEEITFTATDPENAQDSKSATFTVTAVNDPPRFIAEVPGQTIVKGQSFQPVDLSQYVTDVDNSTDELSITASGNSKIQVWIAGLTATLTISDTSWVGSETITFTVYDLDNASDSAEAEFKVTTITSVDGNSTTVPEHFALNANYPNPFNPQTTIPFELQQAGSVTLDIYSVDGRHITTLLDQHMQAGRHKITWDAVGLASGTYILTMRVRTNNGTLTYQARQKMLLLR